MLIMWAKTTRQRQRELSANVHSSSSSVVARSILSWGPELTSHAEAEMQSVCCVRLIPLVSGAVPVFMKLKIVASAHLQSAGLCTVVYQ